MESKEIIKQWREKGDCFLFIDYKIFYIDSGITDNETIFILHGYPSCSYDYKDILPTLSEKYRVVILDFLGFGLSDKPKDNPYLLTTQADIVEACCNHLDIATVHLIAHNYGTSVATELICRSNNSTLNFQLNSVTLCNGSMLIDMSRLRPIQKLLKHPITGPIIARISNKNTFHRNMKNIWFDPEKYDREAMQPIWDILVLNGGKSVLPKVTRYINQRYEHYERWIGGLKEIMLPVHILWAANDPVAIVEMTEKLDQLIQNSSLTIIKECGHYPMIEKGDQWAGLLLEWINNQVIRSSNQ